MDLKRLEYFVKLVDTGTFTAAAEKIGIAQPALSIAIKKLEQELNLTLINRADKNTLLTAEGKVLYRSAKKLLEEANQLKLELQELKDLNSGTLKFGVSAMMGSYYFPEVLTDFKKDYPGIKIELIDQGTSSLKKMLLSGNLDLAFIRADKKDDNLEYTAIVHEEVVAGLSSRHPLASRKHITLEQFCEYPLVLFHEGYFLREVISHYANSEQKVLDIRMETNLIELQKSLVKNQIGITTCLQMILKNEETLTGISFKPNQNLILGLAWKRSTYQSNACRVFIQYLQKVLNKAV